MEKVKFRVGEKMNFIKADIFAEPASFDLLTGILLDLGVNGFEIVDNKDFEEFLQSKEGNWDYIESSLLQLKNAKPRVTVYFEDNDTGREIFLSVKEKLDIITEVESDLFGDLVIEEQVVDENDWANNWKQFFKPFNIGDKLIVTPSWEAVYNPNRKILKIDPGSSFGTGQHQTTKLCLENLERHIHGGEKVLDVGCGSGILSVGAMLLGADSVCFGDISENAVKSAEENLNNNGIDKARYSAFLGDITKDKALLDSLGYDYDIICANIVADVLINMSDLFVKLLKKNGMLFASGIIVERVDEVRDALEKSGLQENYIEISEGWCIVTMSK